MEGILGRIIATVLGLLALAGLAYAGYNAFQSSKASTVVTDMAQLITNARAGFSGNSNGYTNFTNANAAALITAGIIPPDLVKNGALVDPWGNPLTLTAQGQPLGSMGQIMFGGGGSQSKQQCVTVVTGMKDYVSIVVGQVSFAPPNLPDPVTAANACANNVTIKVTFQ